MKKINSNDLLQKLQAAGLPVISVQADGNIKMQELTEEQQEAYNDILEEHLQIKNEKRDLKKIRQKLAGKKLKELSPSERMEYDNLIGRALGILDETNTIIH